MRPSVYDASRHRQAAMNETGKDAASRLAFFVLVFGIIALAVCGRLVYLSLIVGPQNADSAISARTQTVTESARRGTIYDRNGNVLAMSVDATTIYCNPSEVTDPDAVAQALVEVFGGSADDYKASLTKENASFAYLYRKADTDAAQKIKDRKFDGVYFLGDVKRVYPCGQTAGQIVGLTDVDGKGVSGLELYYNDVLSGEDGELEVERGGNGYPVTGGVREVKAATDGQDIVVSIDVTMQEYLESRLTQAVGELKGKQGQAVLYDGATGEVVACASTPYMNPGDRSSIQDGSTTLRPISTAYEPGSIFKCVTMAAILEANVLGPQSEIYCPNRLTADQFTITDAHERSSKTMTLTEILAESSNIGTSLAASKLGFAPLYNKIQAYGLTSATGIDFPGESSGRLTDQSTWSTAQSYNVSFGQGVTVTPLQMVRFYGALANNGVAWQPHFLLSKPQSGEGESYASDQIIENTSAIEPLVGMMQQVVKTGTGTDGQMEGFEPAGKTGTAQYTADGSSGYVKGKYNISFCGFLPHTTSKLVCFVSVSEVPNSGSTAGAFKDIMQFAVNHYSITPE
ncbi:peptidoglycan D,D-transpeptidase FtsI family protein [Hugonella massiliensis]|uniref:peptidoglycan D,D-transpeptidase FtsI family protein n=1 Tax=Hugonella massiliensis TaxID=1720315 RepID=UPI0009EC2819|nr:penicillin-binding protein 2 [Hugonella massiliensis]